MTAAHAKACQLPRRGRGTVRRRDGAAGFTLLELMLGLSLMALLAALVLPGLRRPAGPATLRTTAYEVSALLRDTRTAAIDGGQPTSVVVDRTGGAIEAGGRRFSLPAGIRIDAGRDSGSAIRFAPDGTTTGGTLLLATRATHLAVAVDPDTGAIALDP